MAVFGAKCCEIAHTKIALAAIPPKKFEMDFCFVSSKNQIKMWKIAIFEFPCFARKLIQILSQKAVFGAKSSKIVLT